MENLQILFVFILILFLLYGQMLPEQPERSLSTRGYWIGYGLIMAVAILTRLWGLDMLPYGINQDEAAAAYDGWALAHFGIDRNNYTFPILPKSWGDGAGGFYFYVMMLVLRFLPMNPWTIRLPNALLHIASIAILGDLLRRTKGQRFALIAMLFLTISPWHVMLSRWALDANQVFALTLFGVYFTTLGVQIHRRYHLLAMVFYALAMYSYGSGIAVVPLVMLFIYGELWWSRHMTFQQLLKLVATTLILTAPLLAFYAINIFKLPEFRSAWFSLPRFTAMRSVAVMIPLDSMFWTRFGSNMMGLLGYLAIGVRDWPWNLMEGFGVFYTFTFPLLMIGLYRVIRHFKRTTMMDRSMLYWFVSAAIFSLFLIQYAQRMALLFIPMIYFHAMGMDQLMRASKWFGRVTLALFGVSFMIFGYTYITEFNPTIQDGFSAGYNEAVDFAVALDKEELHVPPHPQLNGGDVMILYALQPDPNDYLNRRGDYWDDQPAFALYFMHGDLKVVLEPLGEIQQVEPSIVYVIKTQDAWRIQDATATRRVFTHFTVIYQP